MNLILWLCLKFERDCSKIKISLIKQTFSTFCDFGTVFEAKSGNSCTKISGFPENFEKSMTFRELLKKIREDFFYFKKFIEG